jgi:D-alanyl-D-alanine carboxypeptidase
MRTPACGSPAARFGWPPDLHADQTRRCTLLALALALCACQGGLEAETLPELLQEAVDLDLPGIVIVVRSGDGSMDFDGAAGWADVRGRRPMTPDAAFRIASNSKAFVGLALASLAREGRVDLDIPMGSILDTRWTDGIANAREATLRQALQHTSGIMDYLELDAFDAAVERGRSTPWTLMDTLAFARGRRAYFTVGAGWGYSNTNYILAGAAMEVVTGESWAAIVRSRVMDPIGMTDSWVEHLEEARHPIVHGYYEGERDMFAIDTGYGLPDGGIVATAGELAAFIRAVGGGPVPAGLNPAAVQDLLADTVRDEDGDRYGLGLSIFSTPCGRTIGHGGGIDGYLSDMFYVPDRDLTVILFVNASDGWVDDLYDEVSERALEIVCSGDGG